MSIPNDFPKFVTCYRAIANGDAKLLVGHTYKVHAVQGDRVHVIVGLNTVAAVHFSRFLPTNVRPDALTF